MNAQWRIRPFNCFMLLYGVFTTLSHHSRGIPRSAICTSKCASAFTHRDVYVTYNEMSRSASRILLPRRAAAEGRFGLPAIRWPRLHIMGVRNAARSAIPHLKRRKRAGEVPEGSSASTGARPETRQNSHRTPDRNRATIAALQGSR